MARRPNVLFVVSDQERERSWLPPSVRLPWRERLMAEGVELANHWTHSAPCSPSRATMMTGRYLPGHEVYDNTVFPWHTSLDPAIPTVGSVMGAAGYRSSYIGKWHLTGGPTPPMDQYGYADWDGNSAARWLDVNGAQADPWFLTVALVNPHDVMWFPMDQPAYQAAHPDELEATEALLASANWKDGEPVPPFTEDYPDVVEGLPASFEDDLLTKPACHRQWRWDQQHWLAGYIDPADRESWRRQLDYYVRLHQLADESLGKVLAALERSGAWDDTVIVFTSDHGDMCGSHGLRSKGPFVYDEIMRVPCYVKPAAGMAAVPGARSESLSSHVDLARTICGAGGVEADPGFQGVDLLPLVADPTASVRDHVLFGHATAHTSNIRSTRWSIRGIFDGRHKYARYYGVGGGLPNDDFTGVPTPMLYGPDAAFEDQEHEWYDQREDPHELVNLAMDHGRKAELRSRFDQLKAIEAKELVALG
jgi:arylsulfatase A-like enzyme